ncbi:phosphatidate cytidylyltransferase [Propionivibrio limicola]|uniref:phosphatidate cytidylyltransferase n=1 Tax=Propionivibrio limicola TaxID=167645 RepID=UPI001292AB97|nr:phosphatidate cytidylyltransferase [Propionivibrio limicola]
MLKTRIITAVVLLAAFCFALFRLSSLGWTLVATLVAAIAAWEWGGLMRLGKEGRLGLAIFFAGICGMFVWLVPEALGIGVGGRGIDQAAWSLGRWFYIPAAIFWFGVVPLWMRSRWALSGDRLGAVWGVLTGVVVILPAWLALVQLRMLGAWTLIAVMAVAWVADVAAYFSGRAFGRHKLAPTISPGKTWEGAFGGAAAVVVYVFFIVFPRLPTEFADRFPWYLFFAFAVLLTIISVIGDLFESLLKRQAGLKDSSSILPGHGGVLDRIDSLTSMLPLVALVWLGTLS